jgi:hypothetical protein
MRYTAGIVVAERGWLNNLRKIETATGGRALDVPYIPPDVTIGAFGDKLASLGLERPVLSGLRPNISSL